MFDLGSSDHNKPRDRNPEGVKFKKSFYLMLLFIILFLGGYLLISRYPYLERPLQFYMGGPRAELLEAIDLPTHQGVELHSSQDYTVLTADSERQRDLYIYDYGLELKNHLSFQSGARVEFGEEGMAIIEEDQVSFYDSMGNKVNQLVLDEDEVFFDFSKEYAGLLKTVFTYENQEIVLKDSLRLIPIDPDGEASNFQKLVLEDGALLQSAFMPQHNLLAVTYMKVDSNPGYYMTFVDLSQDDLKGSEISITDIAGPKHELYATPLKIQVHGEGMVVVTDENLVFYQGDTQKGTLEIDPLNPVQMAASQAGWLFVNKVTQEGSDQGDEYQVIRTCAHGEVLNSLNLRESPISINYHKENGEFQVVTEGILYRIGEDGFNAHRTPFANADRGSFASEERLLQVTNGTLSLYKLEY